MYTNTLVTCDWYRIFLQYLSIFNIDHFNENLFKNIFCRVSEGTKPGDEPKFVIFYNMLVALFQRFCFHCKWDKPSVEVHRIGTMASVTQKCNHSGKVYCWKSQPSLFTKHPAGNVMLSFGIMASGAKISQTLLMFKHMGLSAI